MAGSPRKHREERRSPVEGERRLDRHDQLPSGLAGRFVFRLVRRYRFETIALFLIGLFVVGLLAYPLLKPAEAPPAAPVPTLRPTSTAVPEQVGPTPVRPYVPPRLTPEEAIEVVASQPVNGVPFTSRRQVFSSWSAEYRGDGSWWVRAGEATWLVFDDSRAYMPANRAAINLEGGRRPTVR